jgi:tetratricopeptide (TPR) repeat protein
MLAGGFSTAVDLATEAFEIADRIGSDRTAGSALITRGTALERREDLERGIDLAERSKSLQQLVRGLNNLAELHVRNGDLAGALPFYERQRVEAEQSGADGFVVWARAQQVPVFALQGDWDRAASLVDEVLAEIESSGSHYLEGDMLQMRASLRQARGDAAGALGDVERALELARATKDPQTLVPALATCAWVHAQEDREEVAQTAIAEVIEICRSLERHYYTLAITLIWPVLDLGRETDFIAVFDRQDETDPWTAAAVAAAHGDLTAASARFAAFGAAWFEAEAHLRMGTDAEVERALSFFRRVGASRRVRAAEALLAASA